MPIMIQENIPLAPYTMYHIGGPARFFVTIKNERELREGLAFAHTKKLPAIILGAGSNVLISDDGFNGLVIRWAGGSMSVEGEVLFSDAGVAMARLVAKAAKAGLSGIEWGIGIPGTAGGSIRGNAGCFGGEIAHVLERVRVLEYSMSAGRDTTFELENKECAFGYRNSIFKKYPEWVIVSAVFRLHRGDPNAIQKKIQTYTRERLEKQDIGTKSCGCIFKNVLWSHVGMDRGALIQKFPELEAFSGQENIPASFLIDRAGLKGTRVGAIFISSQHANFFVNDGGGSAADVRSLIARTKNIVKEKYGIELEEEIQYIGF